MRPYSPVTLVALAAMGVDCPAHAAPTLAAPQPSADKEILILAVALRLDLVTRELGLSCFEGGNVNEGWHRNRHPCVTRDRLPARFLIGVLLAGHAGRFAVMQGPKIGFAVENA